MAVLGATAGLQADDALDLDLGAAPAHPHLVGQRQQFVEPVVGQLQHLQHLVLAQPLAALEHLLAGHRQNVSFVGCRYRPSVELPLESPGTPLLLSRVRACGHICHAGRGSLNETVFKVG